MNEKFYAVACGSLIVFIYHENMSLLKYYLSDIKRFPRIELLLEYCKNQGGKAYIQKPRLKIKELLTYHNVNKVINHFNMQMPMDKIRLLRDCLIIKELG